MSGRQDRPWIDPLDEARESCDAIMRAPKPTHAQVAREHGMSFEEVVTRMVRGALFNMDGSPEEMMHAWDGDIPLSHVRRARDGRRGMKTKEFRESLKRTAADPRYRKPRRRPLTNRVAPACRRCGARQAKNGVRTRSDGCRRQLWYCRPCSGKGPVK